MPKFRSIHTKIRQSFDFNDMPDDFTRLLWVLLPLGLDCEGRGIYDPDWIKSNIFPMRKNVSIKQITKAMQWFYCRKDDKTKLGMVEIYEVNGHQYFYVPKFKDYQRGFDKESPSILPPPLPTNSVPIPDKLQTNLPLNAQSQSQSDSHAQSSADSPSDIQLLLEKITGIPPANAGDIKAMTDIEKMNPLPEDIQTAFDWVIGQGTNVYRYSSLVGPVRTSIAKRMQKPKSNLDQSLDAIRQFVEESNER